VRREGGEKISNRVRSGDVGGHYFRMFSAKLSPWETVVYKLYRSEGNNLGYAKCDATMFFSSWRLADIRHIQVCSFLNPLNAKLNPICHLLALLGGATIVVVSRLRVNCLFLESGGTAYHVD